MERFTLIRNSDRSITISFVDSDGVAIARTGPASAIARYTWSRLCKWDDILPTAQFCCFSANNPWQGPHSEVVTILQEENRAAHKTKS